MDRTRAPIYGTLNEIGLMRGNKPTAKGLKKPRLNKPKIKPARHTAMRY